MARDSTSGKTRADRNRAIRQEELRSKLAAQARYNYVLEMLDKLRDLASELSQTDVARINAAIQGEMKLINKYLPDLKSVEHTGEVETGLSDLLSQASALRDDIERKREELSHNQEVKPNQAETRH